MHGEIRLVVNVVLNEIGDVRRTMRAFYNEWLVQVQAIKVFFHKLLNDASRAEIMLTVVRRVVAKSVWRAVDDAVVFSHVVVATEQCVAFIRRQFS